MDNTSLKQTILQIYRDCNVKTFPLSCSSILSYYGLKIYSYSELQNRNKELYTLCRGFSNDAFLYSTFVCYNDEMPTERTRFSLMHELGHYLLHTEDETAANQFASHILAPRCILRKSALTKSEDIAVLFGISREAASYALNDAKKASSPTPIDNELLEHFYRPDLQIYIYHISECPICGSNIYNSIKNTCLQCKKLSIKSR